MKTEISAKTPRAELTTPHEMREGQGTTLVILAGLILGTMGVFVVEAGQDPVTTIAFRCVFGCLALTCWGAMCGRMRELKLERRDLAGAVATGALMATSFGLHYAAIPRTSIGVSTVVFHIQPFWTMVLCAWILKEEVSLKQVGCAILAFLGLSLTTGILDDLGRGGLPSRDYLIGLSLSLSGSFIYAFVPLLAKFLKSVTSFAMVWWQCLVGAALSIWWPILYGWPTEPDKLAWLIGLGTIHSGLAYVLMFTGFARLSAGKVGTLQFVYPLTAFLVDWQVYGHTLSITQGVGVALMAFAIWSIKRG